MTTAVSTRPTDSPHAVRAAALLWLTAVAAGIFETVLAVLTTPLDPGELITGVGLRLVVFAGAVVLTVRMLRGANWARWALTGLLGVLGLLSMVAEPIGWLLAGGSITGALAGADAVAWLFGGSRVLHVLAVLGAVTLMFQPAARAYFRSA